MREWNQNVCKKKSAINTISDLKHADVTENNVDKCYGIGPVDDDGKQNTNIKFTKKALLKSCLEKDGS